MITRSDSAYVEAGISNDQAIPYLRLRPKRLFELAKVIARRDGRDIDRGDIDVQIYEDAIVDCLYEAIDQALYEVSRYGRGGESSEFVERVRLKAARARLEAEAAA